MKILLGITIFYDIVFNHIYFLNSTIFLLLYLIISYLNKRWNKSFFSYLIIFILSLIIFLLTKYLILTGIGTLNKNLIFLITETSKSLFINVLYSIILFYFLGIKKRKA